MSRPTAETQTSRIRFQLGLFGETRSGKTVYLTTLAWLAAHGQLPAEVHGLRPGDRHSAGYLSDRLAMLEAGQWPKGNLDSHPISLLIDRAGRTVELRTNDFKGGDFTAAFCSDDVQDRQRAEQFVQQLFAGCSAYIFLVDADDIRDATENRQNLDSQLAVARQAGAVETTLEILRRRAAGISLFHPPVAVVFTKADRHPQALEDPAAYAKQHLRPTWDYLQRHARGRHQFFAISCTGDHPRESQQPPVPLQPTPGFLSPILWCAEVHRRRIRALTRSLVATIAIALALAFGWLWFDNSRAVADLRANLSQANQQELADRFRQARDLQSSPRFWPTVGLVDVAPVPVELSREADRRLTALLAGRRDAAGHLRQADDLTAAEAEVRQFSQDYTGSEPALRWTQWLDAERLTLGHRTVQQLEQFAAAGNERAFDDLAKQYRAVATPELDESIQRARKTLDEHVVGDRIRVLWRLVATDPAEIEAIREQCTLAEELISHRVARGKDKQFVQLVRKIYDDLKSNGRTAPLRLELISDKSERLQWSVELDGTKKLARSEWGDPLPLAGKRYQYLLGTLNLDLLASKRLVLEATVRRGSISKNDSIRHTFVVDDTLPTATGRWTLSTQIDAKKFEMVVADVDGRIVNYFVATRRLQELGDELFRSAR